MELQVERALILKPLQMISGVVERRQTQPILSHVLLSANSHLLTLTGTDLEVELIARITLSEPSDIGRITVPAKKFIDICKSLPEGAILKLAHQDQQLTLRSGRSRFTLATLPADEFPNLEERPGEYEFSVSQAELRYLIEGTHFSMAQNDVRYYLNGLLFDFNAGAAHSVATDGHRLAVARLQNANFANKYSVIVPRKGVLELMRLLEHDEQEVTVSLTENHLRVTGQDFVFTSKLIDGKFPEYQKVIPKGCNKQIIVEKSALKEPLSRVSILSNEKYRGVRLQFRKNLLRMIANNPEQEEAEEELEIQYQGEELDIGFNVSYLLDVINNLPPGEIKLSLTDSKSSLLIESESDANRQYVVMPMRV